MKDQLIINFLKVRLLGHKININNSEEIIKKCISLGYNDMLSRGKYYLTNELNNQIKDNFYNILKDNNYTFSKKLFKETILLFGNSEKIYNYKNHTYVTRVGLTQKLINMTFKYLYVFQDEIKLNIDFSKCHCPIDSIIFEELEKKTNIPLTKKYIWSTINETDYNYLQDIIKDLIKDEELYNELGNLLFDFKYW